jgi:splicing factor 3A subunit 1
VSVFRLHVFDRKLIIVLSRMDEANVAGPGIGPSIVPPPIDITSAQPPRPAMAAGPGTISSAPQPASMGPPMGMSMQAAPVALPTLHYQGMNAASTFGYQPPPPPGGPPMGMMQRPGMPGAPPGMYGGVPPQGPGGQMAGSIRSADEMNEGEESSEQLAKRQRVAKLPAGHLYPEQNWIDMHPVRALYLPVRACC